MSKTVKLDDATYDKLERFRGKRETFSEAVERLLNIRDALGKLEDILEGQVRFREEQREKLEGLNSLETAYKVRDDAEAYIRAHTQAPAD